MNTKKIFFELYKNKIFYLILFSFIFGVLCRMEWIYWASNFEQFKWNDILMISTNDGYVFAEGARDMLAGFHQENDLSYYDSPLSLISAIIVKITQLPLEYVMLYLSVIFSSLIVIPIILISRDLGVVGAGGIGAFIAVVAHSYYNRTMAGYYDTDMLNIVLPCFVVWGLIRLALDLKGYLIAPLFMLFYFWWYPSSFPLNFVFICTFFLYTIAFKRNDKRCYLSLILMLFSICSFALLTKFAFICALALIIHFKNELLNKRNIIILAILVIACFCFKSNIASALFNLKFYIFRNDLETNDFHFFNVNQTIAESGIVDIKLFSQRISNSLWVFVLSLFGYLLACFRFRAFLLSIPMVLLGFLALKGGLRFTIYAVPFMAFGFGYLVCFVAKLLEQSKQKFYKIYFIALIILTAFAPVLLYELGGKFAKEFNVILWLFIFAFIIYFYIFRKNLTAMLAFCACSFASIAGLLHIYEYRPHAVFRTSEVEVLDRLKHIAQREDYVLSWWDYGYPIRYYSDTKTLIDGGKHLGSDNFAVSKALISPQLLAANIARSEVEYTERKFKENFDLNLAQMLRDYKYNDVNEFLSFLGTSDFIAPKASRDVYFVLPDRMHQILNVIGRFSMLDLKDGRSLGDILFITNDKFNENIKIANDMKSVQINSKTYKTNAFFITKYDENVNLQTKVEIFDKNAEIFIIYMSDYNRFVIVDEQMLLSSFVQLFILENYDKNLFEPVILDPLMKVYKIKK